MIKKFEQFINEDYFSKLASRKDKGEVRNETALGTHSFTDRNGTHWKQGIDASTYEGRAEKAVHDVIKYHIDKYGYDADKPIDLNMIDMSGEKSIGNIFNHALSMFYNTDYALMLDAADHITLDVSGWDFSSLKTLGRVSSGYGYNHNYVVPKFDASNWDVSKVETFHETFKECQMDYNISSWKVGNDIKTVRTFKASWYEKNSMIPDWYLPDPKEWAVDCVKSGMSRDIKVYVDKARKKKEGRPCYLVEFHNSVNIHYIPNNITITKIQPFTEHPEMNFEGLKSLDGIPEISKQYTLIIDLNKLEKPLDIPKNVEKIRLHSGKQDMSKLPKELPCGISFDSENLGYFEYVGGDFFFDDWGKKTPRRGGYKGCPKKVTGDFHTRCITKDLTGCPEYVGGDFHISNEDSLETTKGMPKYIGGDILLYSCGKLKKLEDWPKEVNGNINLSGNGEIESFVGFSEKIGGDLDVGYANCSSLEGFPKEIEGKLIIGKYGEKFHNKNTRFSLNGKDLTLEEIQKICVAKGGYYEDQYGHKALE